MRNYSAVTLAAGAVTSRRLFRFRHRDGTSADATVRFNVATSSATGTAAGVALDVSGGPETFTDGTNTLVVESAQMVLRDIDFHLVETASCTDDGNDDGPNGGGGDSSESGDDHGDNSGSDARTRRWQRLRCRTMMTATTTTAMSSGSGRTCWTCHWARARRGPSRSSFRPAAIAR